MRTPKAAGYCGQLCKHFAHKIPASYEGNAGRIELLARGVPADAEDDDADHDGRDGAIRRRWRSSQDVVARHLERFAFREELAIEWTAGVMDAAVEAVLEAYHARIAEEHAQPPGSSDDRLLAVGPQTGRLINILARSFDAPRILELGTSFGYSGIRLAEAARASGGRVVTMERAAHKAAHAREMAEKAGLADRIEFRVGDAVEMIGGLEPGIDFVLVDLWKDL